MNTPSRILSALTLLMTSTLSTAETPVRLTTSLGVIDLVVEDSKAPQTVENFLQYVDAGFYDNTIFHRVIQGFMIQGGGFTADYQQKKTRPPVVNEANNGLANARGTIAMARTNDPHSATAQFFINHTDNIFLNHSGQTLRGWGYTVFGRVTDGMDVVDAIAAVKTGRGGPFPGDVPVETVTILKAERLPVTGAAEADDAE